MPEMGKPVNNRAQQFANVKMAPKQQKRSGEISEEQRQEQLVNKLTGYKPKNDLYVDGKKHNKMGKDEFLKLLTYQLQNQDPMKPMEQKDMSAQLAQFSQLEQLTNLNTKFDGLQKNQNVEEKFFGASFLGKEVVTTGSSLDVKEEGLPAEILYSLPQRADKVLIRVFDSNNAMMGEIWKEDVGQGSQSVTWDAVMLDGQPAAKGQYRTQVYAWDQNAEPINVQTQVKGKVESVFMENGETVLKVDGKKVYLRDVASFHMPGQGNSKLKNNQAKLGQALSSAMAAPARSNQVRNAATNLPIAQDAKAKVNLKKAQQNAGMNVYGRQQDTSGYDNDDLTSVYDED